MLGNTNHRGNPVGAPHNPTTQLDQAAAHPKFKAPDAGITPSLGDTPSPIAKTTSFTDIIGKSAHSYVDGFRDQEARQAQQSAASSGTP